jgi:hypothetical protein
MAIWRRRPATDAQRVIRIGWWLTLLVGGAASAVAAVALFNMTIKDFHLSGTQHGQVGTDIIKTSRSCLICHAPEPGKDPYSTWSGSLMAQAGRDPLFFAQMSVANQDAANAGHFCMRCHVPLSFVTGHASPADGSALDTEDRDGVTCHFCHSMVDPIYKPGISPAEDAAILAALPEVPRHYANAMFVLDPSGTRRGPRADSTAPHESIDSPFHESGDMCGTCHDVGNVAVTRQPDGSYRYNKLDERPPSEDPYQQFPLERTYTEWKLSAFATGGVDMGGRFGGDGATGVETCQDCHMPVTSGRSAGGAPLRPDLARHSFAGSAVPALDLIAEHTKGDVDVDPAALARGRAEALSMLQRAVSLAATQQSAVLNVRMTNETGHKLPTGHIEGRRIWLNVVFLNRSGALLGEYGHYDSETAELDESSTTVYEMLVALSDAAARVTRLPAGRTGHMVLADTIEKDNRIPPRGFDNAAFAAAGAPVVKASYADGQHWDDVTFPIPQGATEAVVTAYYQSTPRHYIEALRDGNVTDNWGERLHQLWTATGKGAPLPMASVSLALRNVSARPSSPAVGRPPARPRPTPKAKASVATQPLHPSHPTRPSRVVNEPTVRPQPTPQPQQPPRPVHAPHAPHVPRS